MSTISTQLLKNTNSTAGKPPEPPKTSMLQQFFTAYFDAMYQGSLQERWPCERYCEMKWSQLPVESRRTRDFEAFMRGCEEDCEWFKTECRFSRLN